MDKELILTISVRCLEALSVSGHTRDIVMVPFTGEAKSRYFTGSVLGTGCDTQKISRSGECMLSARYMLSGRDFSGKDCRIFIENESQPDGSLRPSIVTDSDALAHWESAALFSEVGPAENGVLVRIYIKQQR